MRDQIVLYRGGNWVGLGFVGHGFAGWRVRKYQPNPTYITIQVGGFTGHGFKGWKQKPNPTYITHLIIWVHGFKGSRVSVDPTHDH